ncbi:uncharacterized protein LOC128182132 [Crassostrea angulata]|uniref:uncharacterized protein LOC128182132 n=1 Tax=Magallana angulata TaxID=2784310 RepID=UPI0022B1038E|nr:uncharacterized protein LOC128182132 [Crassostrea angulata]
MKPPLMPAILSFYLSQQVELCIPVNVIFILTEGVGELQTDVTNIKESFGEFQTDVTSLKEDVEEIKKTNEKYSTQVLSLGSPCNLNASTGKQSTVTFPAGIYTPVTVEERSKLI